MKTVVIISDSHGNKSMIDKIEPLIAENDYVIHLGDGANDMIEIYRKYPEKVFVCEGNCDFYGSRIAMKEWTLDLEGHRLFFCHGDRYGVKTTLERLKREAIEKNCDIALYGHTHIAKIEEEDGILFINPGALSYSSGEPSYCYLVLTTKKAVATIVNIT